MPLPSTTLGATDEFKLEITLDDDDGDDKPFASSLDDIPLDICYNRRRTVPQTPKVRNE
jgi:hypothetical protein